VILYRSLRRIIPLGVLVLAVATPPVFGTYATSAIGLKTLWLGLCAASLTFMASYGGMVSLAQVGLFGVAGLFTAWLSVTEGLDRWAAAGIGIGAALLIGIVFGALASASEGVYFLMITLALSMISYNVFAAVPQFGLHEGINGVFPPAVLGDPVLSPATFYYFSLAICLMVILLVRYLVRTPAGLALQGIRDDPLRMAALGFNPRLYRTLAFALGAAMAGTAGVLSVWSNTRMSAGSISLETTIDVLAAAVIGGLSRLEGAWLGAFVFTVLEIYGPAFTDRYATIIGAIFLVIVLVSPGGLVGILGHLDAIVSRHLGGTSGGGEAAGRPVSERPQAATAGDPNAATATEVARARDQRRR
jgi:branched-chain amino acid transport system permease protein